MRLPIYTLCTLLLVSGMTLVSPSAPAADAVPDVPVAPLNDHDAEHMEPQPIPAEADQVVLTLVPSNFNLNRSISFDENGEPRHRNNQLSINFRCFYEAVSLPLSYRDLQVTSILTSAGEELEIDPNQQRRHQQTIRPNRQRNGKPYFDIYLNLPAPRRHAETIRELRGSVQMRLSRGPERVLRFAPVSEYLGKRFRVTDMDDSPMSMQWVEARDNQPAMLEWTFARSIEPMIQEVKFYRRNGVEFEVPQRGGGGDQTTRSQRYAVDAADDLIMVVSLFRSTRTVEVPFVVNDVPLPIAEPDGPRFDLAIATQPMGEPVGLEAREVELPADIAQPGENDLPIIILE
ncbi:MAG: hypothetical protein AAGJ38_08045 [Planctomycetota bacterium]